MQWQPTNKGEAFSGEAYARPVPGGTKEGSGYEKRGLLCSHGRGPCDRNCHLGEE